MSQSWFDQAEESSKDAESGEEQISDVTAGGDDGIDDEYPTAVLRPIGTDGSNDPNNARPVKPTLARRVAVNRVRPPAAKKRRRWERSTTAVMAMCAAGIVVIGVAGGVLALSGNDDPEPPAPMALSSASAGADKTAAASSSAVGVAGACSATGSQVDIDADPSTLRGAVAAFETAYYRQDADGIGELVAAGSGLAATDWESVLPEAAPAGVTWCAVMQPPTGAAVDVDLTVTVPGGDVTTYRQTIRGEQKAGSWQLVSVAAR